VVWKDKKSIPVDMKQILQNATTSEGLPKRPLRDLSQPGYRLPPAHRAIGKYQDRYSLAAIKTV